MNESVIKDLQYEWYFENSQPLGERNLREFFEYKLKMKIVTIQ